MFSILLAICATVSSFCQCPPDGLAISPSNLPQGSVGSYYFVQFSASGGTTPYYFYTETMPVPWLSLTSDGRLYGTPQEAGRWTLSFEVKDSSYPYTCYGYFSGDLIINDSCPLIFIKPSELPSAQIGTSYSQTLTAEGGVQPYYYSIKSGNLPPGISLSREGTISGTPIESGSFNFLVTANDSINCEGSQSYSLTVECQSNYGTLNGYVGISSDAGQSLFILDGDSVSGTVTARSSQGDVFTSQIENGAFNFGSVPVGTYSLSGQITYKDNILYDAKLLSYGCSAPSNSYVSKISNLPAKSVEVKCDSVNIINYAVAPPFVMIHGSYDCYNKWFSNMNETEEGTYFDNYARQIGFISFTPNYDWWNGSYISMADEVLEQIGKNLSGLTKSGIPPYYVITHDTGSLVLRVLSSEKYRNNSVAKKIKKAFLLAPPNSGFDFNLRFGNKKQAGESLITRYFNEAYPNFGKISVFPIAGDNGWWGSKNNDGMVSLNSVFNIQNVSCIEDDCIFYPSMKLPYGVSQILPYTHKQMGSPESLSDVFNLILSNSEGGIPEAPVGAVGWGTTGVTSKKIGGGTGALFTESVSDYPFYISKCDGMAIVIKVISGSATFKFVDANGLETVIENDLFLKSAPSPGNCFLRVLPDSGSVSFEATVLENSVFGIKPYLTSQNFLAGENATLRVDKIGDWSLVSSTQMCASLYDSDGTLLKTISLIEKGGYYSGSFVAPQAGNYVVVVEATGLYNNSQFSRTEFETMSVISDSHLFLNSFADYPSDLNGNGNYDSISLSYSLNIPQSGYYVVSADIYDFLGNFVSHGSDAISSNSSGIVNSSIDFDLSSASCEQFAGKFSVVGLKLVNGDSLNTLDVWGTPIQLQNYSQLQFECNSSPLLPSPSYITPSAITKGRTADVAISGKNFKENLTIIFESPISVLSSVRYSDRVILAKISIPESTQNGYYDLLVINPDGKTGKIENALLVSDDSPPEISFEYPEAGSKIGGVVNVVARASDDVKVASVSFALDGAVQETVTSYPFIWNWDTSKSGQGMHVLKITATDSSNKTSSVEETVEVGRNPTIISMFSKSDPFRIVVLGREFMSGIEVYINNERWDNVVLKSSSKIVLKGGSLLKAKVPKGARTTFRFVNPDGGETTYIYRR